MSQRTCSSFNFTRHVNTLSGQLSQYFVDLIKEHQHFSDTLWSFTHKWHSSSFVDSLHRNPAEIAKDVFKDPAIEV